MAEKFEPKAPDYKGDGIAIWKAEDKTGKMFLRVKILNSFTVSAFKYEPKPKKDESGL